MLSPDRYAVIGHPVAHSKSPRIHQAFAEQTGQCLEYRALDVLPEGFGQQVTAFFAEGGRGLNVTVPHKEAAFRWADELGTRAQVAGAVNTLIRLPCGRVRGDNTDGVGLVRDMTRNLGWNLPGRRILILGAGGAVRGILQPLLETEPAVVVVANRTVEKAQRLAEAVGGGVQACGFADLLGQSFDLIINGTSASLGGELPPLPAGLLAADACCYDLMYAAEPTVFLRWAANQGAADTADGLGMLVEQAAESFFLWRGVRPDTTPVCAMLRAA